MSIPQDIAHNLLNWFGFPSEDVFCQVATTSKFLPHLRTMKLYEITSDGKLVFITSTTSQKWQDLKKNTQISICMFQPNKGQIIIEGDVKLIQYRDDQEVARQYWHNIDPYWQSYYLKLSPRDGSELPDSFGIIMVTPTLWDLLEICKEDYLKSVRKEFNVVNSEWVSRDILPG